MQTACSTPVSPAQADAMVVLFKALAHPVRLKIVSLLLDEDRCVCEILDALGTNQQSNTSQHLSVLRSAGVVRSERDGQNVVYSLCCDHVRTLYAVAFTSRCVEGNSGCDCEACV